MAARFGTLGNNRRGSTTCHEARQRHRGNDRDDLDARLVPRLHVLGGIAGARHDDRHSLVNHDLRDLVGKRAHEHDVDAKGLIRPGAQLMNLVAKPVGVGVHGRDDSQPAGLGHSRGKRGIGNPGHTALEHGLFDAEQIAERSLEHLYFSNAASTVSANSPTVLGFSSVSS